MIVLLTLFFSSWCLAEPLSLRAAVDHALLNNPTLQNRREKILEMGAAIGETRALIFPTLNAVANTNRKRGNPNSQYSFGFEFSQKLFQFGIFSGLNQPIKEKQIRELDLEITTRDLTKNVIRSFFQVILNQKALDALRETESIEKESLQTAQKRFAIGRGQRIDVLQAQTQLALLAPKIAEAQVRLEVSRRELIEYLGYTEVKDFNPVGSLDAKPLVQIKKGLDTKSQALAEYKKILLSQESLKDERDYVLGKNWPELSAIADWGKSANTPSDLTRSSSTTWTVGLQLTIPLFSGLSSVYQRQSFAARTNQLSADETSLNHKMQTDLLRAQKNVELAENSIIFSHTAFSLANSSLQEAKRNYKLATIDFLQYLSVQQSYLEAQQSLNQAKFTYLISLTDYFISSGLPMQHLVNSL